MMPCFWPSALEFHIPIPAVNFNAAYYWAMQVVSAPIPYPIRHLFIRSREVLKARD